jgi:hypothetical protein
MTALRKRTASNREGPPGMTDVKYYDELLRELPASVLATAVEAALDQHKPERYHDWGGGYLCSCWHRGGGKNTWPCPEVLAIVAALGNDLPSLTG